MAKKVLLKVVVFALLLGLPIGYFAKAIKEQQRELEVLVAQLELVDASTNPESAIRLELQKGFAEMQVAFIVLILFVPCAFVAIAIILIIVSPARDKSDRKERTSSLSEAENQALRRKASRLF